MRNFIEVHGTGDTPKLMICIDRIMFVLPQLYGTQIYFSGKDWVKTRETYDEIMNLITEAGNCFVRKDPRIDTKPLTFEDLCDMTGEPVWGENQQKWFLVNEVDHGLREADLADSGSLAFTVYTEKDLIAKPLYRIRRMENDE